MITFTAPNLEKALEIDSALRNIKNAADVGKFVYNWKAAGQWVREDGSNITMFSDKWNPSSYLMRESCIYVIEKETHPFDSKLTPTRSSRIVFNIFADNAETISYLHSLK